MYTRRSGLEVQMEKRWIERIEQEPKEINEMYPTILKNIGKRKMYVN